MSDSADFISSKILNINICINVKFQHNMFKYCTFTVL